MITGTLPGWTISLALLLGRVAAGLYFLLAGVSKINGGIRKFVEGPYTSMVPDFLPDFVAIPYGWSIPILEVLLGAMLIVGVFTRTAALITFLMVASFTAALFFADRLAGHGSGPFSPNFIYLALVLMITVMGAGAWSLDRIINKGGKK